jgi:hypothetical protein
MQQHDERLQRIKELYEQLSAAIATSFRVREQAEALKEAVEDILESAPPERRSVPRFKARATSRRRS